MHRRRSEKPIWASWKVRDDGGVDVVATYAAADGYRRRESSFVSLEEASDAFGPGFAAVLNQAIEAGSYSGRWRP